MTNGLERAYSGGLADRIPFLARLERDDATALLKRGHRQLPFAPRAVMLRQYEPSDHVLIIEQGWSKVTATAVPGYEGLLALRGSGDIVGESAALSRRRRSATVTAMERVTAVAIPREDFISFLESTPRAAMELTRLIDDRRRSSDRRRLELAVLTAKQQLAVVLLELAALLGRDATSGPEITVRITQQELAGAVGASREAVSRLYRDLKARQILRTQRGETVILRPQELRRIGSEN